MQKEKKADEGREGWRDNKLRSLLLNDSDSPSGHPFSLSVLLICLCVCEDMHKEEASVCVQKRWEDVKYRGRDNAAKSVRGGLSQWHQPSGTPPNLVGFNVHIKIKNGVFVWKHLDFLGGLSDIGVVKQLCVHVFIHVRPFVSDSVLVSSHAHIFEFSDFEHVIQPLSLVML